VGTAKRRAKTIEHLKAGTAKTHGCICGSGKKSKRCCGRFTFQELTDRLTAWAEGNRRKDLLVEKSLAFLANAGDGAALVMVKPKPSKDGLVAWTHVTWKEEEKETVIRLRVLNGYLPMCCLIRDIKTRSGYAVEIPLNIVDENVRDEFVAYGIMQAHVQVNTLTGKLNLLDSWFTDGPPTSGLAVSLAKGDKPASA
jgi:hypothetical protein